MINLDERASLPLGTQGLPSTAQWRLRWNWDWPLWLTVLLVGGAIAWVVVSYLRENSSAGRGIRLFLAALRVAAFSLALLMLAQPAIEWFQLGRPRMVVLVDTSASMATLDRDSSMTRDVSRIEAWQSALTEGQPSLLSRWQEEYQLEVLAFSDKARRIEESDSSVLDRLQQLQATEDPQGGTRLGDAIDYALRDLPGPSPVALVVFSDGIGNRGKSLVQAAQQARRMRVSLHTVAIGSDRRRPDIAVENLIVEETVFPGDRLQVEATVRAIGYQGKTVEVQLRNDGGELLANTTIELPSDENTKAVTLSVRPDKAGELPLTVSIAAQEEEKDVKNNRVSQTIDVLDEKIRVLLVDSQPTFEYRALKSLLERDPAVELKVLLQEADAEYATVDDRAVRAFPMTERALFEYDVLILGDVDLALLPRSVWPLIERFVTEHGGGLVGIAGPRFMPFAYRGVRSFETLLPMRLESLNSLRNQLGGNDSFAAYPTALGWRAPSLLLGETLQQSQQVWQALPKLTWLLRLDEVKPGAQVLAECSELTNRQGQRLPIILRHYVGAGEVLFHATDETWRWRYRSDDRYFARYWGQVVRRLGRGRLAAGRSGVQLSADRALYKPGETVELQARFRNPANAPAAEDGVVIRLQGRTAPAQQLSLQRRIGRRGLFAAKVPELPPGEYEAQIVRPDLAGESEVARFRIHQPPQELARVVVNQKGLREAAETTGGKFYTITEASRLSEELPPPRAQTIDQRPPQQLWNSNLVIAMFVLALTTEWLLRRRVGML